MCTGESGQAGGRLDVIPALRQWTPLGSGAYAFGTDSRIVVARAYAGALTGVATTFAGDIAAAFGVRAGWVAGEPVTARRGDIYLTLGSADRQLGAEGYRMDVGTTLTLSARTAAGAFYGTRTVLQLLHQRRPIPAGTARDWPQYAERGLMVDQGLKYFTVAWLADQIRELAYLKMNVFHFHLSDYLGFRLESTGHPELTSTRHYTKQQIRSLLALAAQYHVTIIPEIDMPGHMDAILASHPGLSLPGEPGKLDLSQPVAYSFARDIVSEYLDLFPSRVWHLGADEYLTASDYARYPQLQRYAAAHYGPGATGQDAYLGFIDYIDQLVRAAGKTLRIWNDGLWGGHRVAVNPDVDIEHWADSGMSPAQAAGAGHRIVNANGDYLYYVLGKNWKPDPPEMYAHLHVGLFAGGHTLPDSDSRLLGAMLEVWGDVPAAETEQHVAAAIVAPLSVLAQVDWGSPKPAATYSGFSAVMAAVGRAPGGPGAA
jgi:hexosaminidase